MSTLSHQQFLKSLPDALLPQLPAVLRHAIHPHQPFRWLVQFHFGEPRLHYEVQGIPKRNAWELGFHWEAKDIQLNRYLLDGFRRHLFEIKDQLGHTIEAEMWDKGWAKIYDIYPSAPLTLDYQYQLGERLATLISCFQPIFITLRQEVKRIHR